MSKCARKFCRYEARPGSIYCDAECKLKDTKYQLSRMMSRNTVGNRHERTQREAARKAGMPV